VSTGLDRQAGCPNCGATVTFAFGGALSVVCGHCHDVVVRTDRGVQSNGRMAELLELPTPFTLERTGTWRGEAFDVQGRVQMDRADQASAPWQEILVWFPNTDATTWVAYAQGKWYATNEAQAEGLPAFESLQPGGQVQLGTHGVWVVQEISQRRVVSGEGAMTNVPKPGVITRYADISAEGGRFGTIDYGDGSAPPELYLGHQFDPAEVTFDDGMPLEAPEAKVSAVECPNCGASLPIQSQSAERVVCQYCGTASDMQQGALAALGPTPKPPVAPEIPIGQRGTIRGQEYVVTGFVIRSCMVEGMRYPWREYLLFGGESAGYRWLTEEDGAWSFVEPMDAGAVQDSGNTAIFKGESYSFRQSVQAVVECVIGEFYWKVEIGETVEATEWGGAGGKVSREKSPKEVSYSFVTPTTRQELASFGLASPVTSPGVGEPAKKRSVGKWLAIGCGAFVVLPIVGFMFLMGIAAATAKDFQDVIDGEVKLDKSETAAIVSMLKQSGIKPESITVHEDTSSTCDWCKGVIIDKGHVTVVRIERGQVKTVAPVGKLPQLEILRLPHNQVTAVSGLAGLAKLRKVDLSHNKITKLDDMSGCTALAELDLRSNQLGSLSGLAGLPKLGDLKISNNPITSIDGMTGLDALTTLELTGAKLTSFKGLGNLPKLTSLVARNVGLSSLEGLDGLTGLTQLTVPNNKLTSLESLAPMPKLVMLDASKNQITTFAGLDKHPLLKDVRLSGNKLTSIGGKDGSATIESLDVSSNSLATVKDVAPFPKLKTLKVGGNTLAAVGAIATLTGLTYLAINNNRLTALGPLAPMSSLKTLNVAGNQLTSIDGLASMTKLSDVDASNNRIVTATGFLARPPLHYSLAGNPGAFPTRTRGRYAAPPPSVSSPSGKSGSGYRGGGYRGGK
jgi:Leucine-rich repeat (LRR) protein/ribosomal protein S27AE